MPRLSSLLSRIALVATLAVSAFSPLAALPTAAQNVQFSCWCQNTTTRTCNHHQIDSGIVEDDWDDFGLAVISPAGWLALATYDTIDNLLNDNPALEARLASSDVRQACRDRCAADGSNFRAIHFETNYREEICSECNPSPDSSCNESQSGRLAFGDEATNQAIAQCEERQAATSLLPVRLAIPIGGVSEVAGLPEYINVAYRYMVTIVLVVAIVMVVYGGFRYLVGASLGDIQAGKKIIQDAIVGMLIVLGAYTILSTINPDTTVLKFEAPEPIDCQELATPSVIKNARCSSDSECGAGKRCVPARNIVFDPSAIAEGAAEGAETGRETGAAIDQAGGIGRYLGDGAAGSALLTTAMVAFGPLNMAGLLAADEGIASLGGYEVIGEVEGLKTGAGAGLVVEMYRSSQTIRVCSTGEQGSPCLATGGSGPEGSPPISGERYCRAGLTCINSWGMCWPESGNGPGMPCDRDSQCSGGRECVEVEGTDYKVCEIEVRDSTPCFYPEGGTTVFPAQCGGLFNPELEFSCMWCPSGEGGTERVWQVLNPSMPFSAQCKPRAVVGTSCVR
jgi:hypothetical protein